MYRFILPSLFVRVDPAEKCRYSCEQHKEYSSADRSKGLLDDLAILDENSFKVAHSGSPFFSRSNISRGSVV